MDADEMNVSSTTLPDAFSEHSSFLFNNLGPVRFAQRGMPTQYKYCSGAKGKDEVLNNKEKRR
jgi:hypothetical protein